jgi:hypothetical protein
MWNGKATMWHHPLFLQWILRQVSLQCLDTIGTWIFLKLNQFWQVGGDKMELEEEEEEGEEVG